jgi:phosphopantetheine--protein transferase-like protein
MSGIVLPESWRSRALAVDAVNAPLAESLLPSWFTAEELEVADGFPHAKRRGEWLLSRYALKRLAHERGLAADPRTLAVTRPQLDTGHWIAISHTRGAAAVALDDAPLGIDIERVRDIDEGVTRHFLTDREIEAMRRCTLPNRLLHWWCAKEAAWKQQGGEVRFLRQIPLHLQSQEPDALRFKNIETFATERYVLALTVGAL